LLVVIKIPLRVHLFGDKFIDSLKAVYRHNKVFCTASFLGGTVTERFDDALNTIVYGRDNINHFKTKQEVIKAITNYIWFYNNHRFQIKLKNLSPVEYRTQVCA
jgi:hypothetical protein